MDKEKVAKEIECLGQRWDALLKKAENRSVITPVILNVHLNATHHYALELKTAHARLF